MPLPAPLATLDTVPADGSIFESKGYYANYDGGHLKYVFDAASVIPPDGVDQDHPGLVYRPLSISGVSPGRWIALVDRLYIDARWFGVKADNVQDDTDYLQAAIDRAINASAIWPWGCHEVVMPKGFIKTTDTIHVGYGNSSFSCLHLRGSTGRSSFFVFGTIIKPTQTDRPVINFQGARLGKASQFGIVSSLVAPVSLSPYASWTAVFPEDQHKQFAGITVDAYSGADPVTGYTNAPFGWSKWHSSDVMIESVHFEGLSCGFMLKPSGGSGADGNGDYARMRDCSVNKCKYAFSINGSQTRGNRVQDCKIVDCYAAVGIGWYGTTLGRSSWIENCAVEGCNWIIKGRNIDWIGQIVIKNVFGERMSGCVDLAAASGKCCVTVENCDFVLLGGDDSTKEERYFVSAPQSCFSFNGNRVYNEGVTRNSIIIFAGTQTSFQNNIFYRTVTAYGAPRYVVVAGSNDGSFKYNIRNNGAGRFVDFAPTKAAMGGAMMVATYIGNKRYTGQSPSILNNNAVAGDIIAYKQIATQQLLLFKVIVAASAANGFGIWTIEQINECNATDPLDSAGTVTKLGISSATWIIRPTEPVMVGPAVLNG